MVHIRIKKGLDIPLPGNTVENKGALNDSMSSKYIALDLSYLVGVKCALSIKENDEVLLGQPLAFDKELPDRKFVSPCHGKIIAIRRGEKRKLHSIIIEKFENEKQVLIDPVDIESVSKEEILSRFLQYGIFSSIRSRPCSNLAKPSDKVDAIFVKALESAPFTPSPIFEIKQHLKLFQYGLQVLSSLTKNALHVVMKEDEIIPSIAEYAILHSANGPHPIANPSIHIDYINPIEKTDMRIWTLSAYDVICIGSLFHEGKFHTTRLVNVAGDGILEDKRGYYSVRVGTSISSFTPFLKEESQYRIISGNPLTGNQVTSEDFLGKFDTVFCAIKKPAKKSNLFHFLRLRSKSYSATNTYFHPSNPKFDTLLHGEVRPFIDGSVYNKVMPLSISVMHLIKAILANDFDKAVELGLLEVDVEDFALPEFICPSKIPLMDIVKSGLQKYTEDFLQL